MKKLISLAIGLLAPLTIAHAESPTWSVTAAQGARQLSVSGDGHFQKKAFQLVFKGPSDYGYAVLASENCDPLRKLNTTEEISQAIRPTNIVAEYPEANKNVFLHVNETGSIEAETNGAHLWAESSASDIHSFQAVKRNTSTTITATRNITSIFLGDSKNMTPVSEYAKGEICMLITGLPPVGRMLHESPQLIHLIFD